MCIRDSGNTTQPPPPQGWISCGFGGWGAPAYGHYGKGGGIGGYHGEMHSTNITNEYNTINITTNNDNDVTDNTTNNEIIDGAEQYEAVGDDGSFNSEPQMLQQEYPPEHQYNNQQVYSIRFTGN